ncbi:MAG: aminoglycoside phosphotransferase, partial [Segatella copri]
NILWKQDDEGFHFMLVDINRMDFGPVSEKKGLYNLRRFWGPKEFTRILVSEYALLRNIDTDKAVAYVMKERARFWTKYGKKHEIPFQLEL